MILKQGNCLLLPSRIYLLNLQDRLIVLILKRIVSQIRSWITLKRRKLSLTRIPLKLTIRKGHFLKGFSESELTH